MASVLLAVLIYTHVLLNSYPARCLDSIHDDWPRKGIIRMEVIQNLAEYREMQSRNEKASVRSHCRLDLAEILRNGELPVNLRAQLNDGPSLSMKVINGSRNNGNSMQQGRVRFGRPLPILFDLFHWLVDQFNQQDWDFAETVDVGETGQLLEERADGDQSDIAQQQEDYAEVEDSHQGQKFKRFDHTQTAPVYHHLVEFSLHYGLLKLSMEMRHELDVEVLLIQLDPEKDECFRDWREKFLMRYLIGMDELIFICYLRDLIGGELYHFVSVGPSSSSTYLMAMIVMLVFTLAISMLLRFSHDQMFVFIIDLFQMFEQNQPMMFPVAPLLTVILALIGMEAIMSEIFNDTTTAFYVILLVWMADQYDAIFCRSPIGRRHWLRFFYLYHFAFYAYHYRYNGLYGGLALLTSAVFTFHSMIYFYHQYELPYIIYQEQLIELANRLPNEVVQGFEAIAHGGRQPPQQQADQAENDELSNRSWRTVLGGLRQRMLGMSPIAALMRRVRTRHSTAGESQRQNDGEHQNSSRPERRAGEWVAEQITLREIVGTSEDGQPSRQNTERSMTAH
uniref:Membralin n=1 Tax=Globodera pallida TaxID=36090 RepID=A0A183CD15_GLOPA